MPRRRGVGGDDDVGSALLDALAAELTDLILVPAVNRKLGGLVRRGLERELAEPEKRLERRDDRPCFVGVEDRRHVRRAFVPRRAVEDGADHVALGLLGRDEEVQAVPHDGTAERDPVLVALVRRLVVAARLGEIVLLDHPLVLEEVEHVAAEGRCRPTS